MATAVRELMSAPPVTCSASASLADAARLMHDHHIGSVVVVDGPKVAGIVTERDLLRSAAAHADPLAEPVRLWMTSHPDVLGPDEEAAAAWASLTHHHFRHLPVVEDGTLIGVVSLRDLLSVAQIRPASEAGVDVPRGLEGVVVAETSVGDVRGEEGFYHYGPYSAVELAATRSLEDVWQLLLDGELPGADRAAAFADRVAGLRALPPGLAAVLPSLATDGSTPLDVLRTGVSVLGAELGWRPTHDIGGEELRGQALHLAAAVPTLLTACHRLRHGREPVAPRPRPRLRRQLPLDAPWRGGAPRARPGGGAVPDPHHRPRLQRLHLHRPGHRLHRRRPGRRRHRGGRPPSPAPCTAGPPAGPSTCSTRSGRPTAPRPGSARRWSGATG